MQVKALEQINPAVVRIQALLHKIDRLRLPENSRRDVESILVRQVSEEIDRILPWQAGHGKRTATFALRMGQAVQFDTDALHQLKLACRLHDIGILMLPAHLRSSHWPLEASSYATLQSHPRLGATLLEPFSFLKVATTLIAHHHERWDGSGYPYGLRGTYIPLGARILAIADAFESIHVPHLPDRCSRNRVALRIIQVASGTQFDPSLAEVLASLAESWSKSALE
jgi:response regulator RpfG family c-di-GMP phosphodiesterase